MMKPKSALVVLSCLACFSVLAASFEPKPAEPYFEQFFPVKAPRTSGLVLKAGDRLAICGDSITEQKMYSRIMETYLTVAMPELNLSIRQYGWGGEQASGFLARMHSDVLRFKPTVATTCYGMNDHRYQPYKDFIGNAYTSNSLGIVQSFKRAGTRVIQGSPGCMGPKAAWGWVQGTPEERNLSLCMLRNLGVQIAKSEKVGFADVFWPMFQAEYAGRQRFGTNYFLAGADSVHPDWAGHLVMAHCFLKALGVPGEIGTYEFDLKGNKAKATAGHEVVSSENGSFTIRSSRYPFCAEGAMDDFKSIRSGMELVPFNQEFNRLILKVKRGGAENYQVTWGNYAKVYSAEQLKKGVNLAADFARNPFSEAFARVDAAVKAKQEFETHQIKTLFHGPEGKADMAKTVAQSEEKRAALVKAIQAAFVPVTHTITVAAVTK